MVSALPSGETLKIRTRPDLFAVKAGKARKPSGLRLGYLPDGDRKTRRFKVPADAILSKPLTVMLWCDGAKMPIVVGDLDA